MPFIKPDGWTPPPAPTPPSAAQITNWRNTLKTLIHNYVNSQGHPTSYEEIRDRIDKLGHQDKYQWVNPAEVIVEVHREMNPEDFGPPTVPGP